MKHYVGRLNEIEFVPFPHPDDPSITAGEYAWIKEGTVQFWRGNKDNMPEVAPYPFMQEEIIYVIEGAVTIELNTGETVTLNAGDVGSFDKGLESTWNFTFPFTKLSMFPETN